MKKFLIILLIVLVIFVGVPFAYLSFSGGDYDDIAALEASSPMSSADRYTVDPSSKTVSVLLDKSDVIRIVSDYFGGDIMSELNSALSDYDLAAESLGLELDGSSALISVRLKFKNFLPLPVSVSAGLKESGGVLSAEISTISIGKLINIEAPDFINGLGSFEYDIRDLNPVLKDVKSVAFGQDCLTATIPYPVSWMMEGIDNVPSDYTMIMDFVDLDERDTCINYVFAWFEEGDSVIEDMISSCDSYPDGLAGLKADILSVGGSYTRSKFFNGDGRDTNGWLFPEITTESVNAASNEILGGYQAIYDERTAVLSDAFQLLLDKYAAGDIILRNGTLVYNEKGYSAVNASELEILQDAADWLDMDSLRVILATNPGDYSLTQVPKGNYITAIIMRTHTDRPVVAYRYTSNMFKIKSLAEEDYTKMMESKRTPEYDLGEHTTQR